MWKVEVMSKLDGYIEWSETDWLVPMEIRPLPPKFVLTQDLNLLLMKEIEAFLVYKKQCYNSFYLNWLSQWQWTIKMFVYLIKSTKIMMPTLSIWNERKMRTIRVV